MGKANIKEKENFCEKPSISEIESLHSIYQYSDQYGMTAKAVKQSSLLECIKLIKGRAQNNSQISEDLIIKHFPKLTKEECKNIFKALEQHNNQPNLDDELLDKIQSDIGNLIKKEWINSTVDFSKKIIPIFALLLVAYFVGQKLLYPKMWRATYFQNKELSGEPFGTYDESIPFHNWGFDPPQKGMSSNNYSARYESILKVEDADYFTFKTISDDGIRLFINDELVLDFWIPQDSVRREATKYLEKGEYNIRLEYFEAEAGARLEFEVSGSKSKNIKFKYPKS